MSDPGQAMYLSAGSLYKVFKDKRSRFLQVFERYLLLRKSELRHRLAPYVSGREKIIKRLQFRSIRNRLPRLTLPDREILHSSFPSSDYVPGFHALVYSVEN
nr:hypothetical protein [Pantoea allii]